MKLAIVTLALALCGGCAADRSAYGSQRCGTGGTNIMIIYIAPEGGMVMLPVGTDALNAAAKYGATSTGIGAASTAAQLLLAAKTNAAEKAVGP
jgi:hypothetical protein